MLKFFKGIAYEYDFPRRYLEVRKRSFLLQRLFVKVLWLSKPVLHDIFFMLLDYRLT